MQSNMMNRIPVGNFRHIASPPAPGPQRAAHAHSQPEIRVNKSGERIDSIVVVCPCGQEVTIVCEYREESS